MRTKRILEQVVDGSGASGGSLEKDSSSGPHGETAISNFLEFKILDSLSILAQTLDAEVSRSAGAGLLSFIDGDGRDELEEGDR